MAPLMYRDDPDLSAPGQGLGQAEMPGEVQRAIIVAAPVGTISERLLYALAREFPWTTIQQVAGIDGACVAFPVPVSLILLDAPLLRAAENASRALSAHHPQALTAVIELNDHKPLCSAREILTSPLVRGVLPMNLGLDIWISVIRLMLCGGEYYPPRMFRSLGESLWSGEASSPAGCGGLHDRGGDADLGDLTAREIQILEMVSRGMQNKMIAVAFQLSEHTVKIHLHNIIRKLGAHNRTEAAARFRNFQERSASLALQARPDS